MKIIFVLLATILSSAAALACSLPPGFDIPLKNNALASVANKYGADLTTAQVSVEEYKHEMAWNFKDAGFQCHDSDKVSMKVTLNYGNPWNSKQLCLVQVNVTEISASEVKDGPRVVKSDIQEFHNTCK